MSFCVSSRLEITDGLVRYLIDRYWSLPDVVVLMHGGRYQWHNDNPLYGSIHSSPRIDCSHSVIDSVISIKDLNTDFVREAGYVNLRCAWPVGCPADLEPVRYLRDRPDDPTHPAAVEYPDRFAELFPGVELPEVVGAPCCSQFAVSREKVREREQEEYVRLRKWLIETDLESDVSGRIIEYSWHSRSSCSLGYLWSSRADRTVVFGKPAQYCLVMSASAIAVPMAIATCQSLS